MGDMAEYYLDQQMEQAALSIDTFGVPDEDDIELALMAIKKSAENIKTHLRTLRASGRLSAFAIAHAQHLDTSVSGIAAALRMEPSDAPSTS